MSKEVIISIKGTQGNPLDDENNEKIEMITTGERYEKNGKTYLHYIDSSLDSEQETKTSIKIEGDRIGITRFGATNTHMIFQKGISHFTPYETAFGIFEVSTYTEDIKLNMDAELLELEVIYTLEIDKRSMGKSSFHLVAKNLPAATDL